MTDVQRRAYVKSFAPVIRDYVDQRVEQHLAPLRAEIAALKARPAALKYRGVWEPDHEYRQDDGVTHSGSIWVALRDTRQRPNEAARQRDWQLAEKGTR